jgi:HD superfamily phosphohydrolase
MNRTAFADIAHQSISFREDFAHEHLVLQLIDTAWVQRLRDISQTANTRLVYMFSEHSRFGHSLGVAYLACVLMDTLRSQHPAQVEKYQMAVAAAALLHDIGHLAPGSHTAFKTWFPKANDCHEELSLSIINQDEKLRELLPSELRRNISQILSEDGTLPPWTWQIISGGGWNVDRGNWCIIDSLLAGVNYGQYNVPALLDSIVLTAENHLALRENRLDAMMHFAVSRHAMYRQVYQHRVILSTDTLNRSIVARARDLGPNLKFADETMRRVLRAETAQALSLDDLYMMRESWWRYHLAQWSRSDDSILADLCDRLLNRRLLKTVRINEHDDMQRLIEAARLAVSKSGFNPDYYLHTVSTSDMHESDHRRSMLVQMDDGRVLTLGEAEPLFISMVKESSHYAKNWLVLPEEAKELLGRER